MHSISLVKTWLTIIVLSVVVACSPAQQVEQQIQLNGNTMGTYYVVKFYSKTPVDQTALQQAIDKELELVSIKMVKGKVVETNLYQIPFVDIKNAKLKFNF